jgi:hypothetical protein
MFEKTIPRHADLGGPAGQRGPRWRGAARATVGVAVQGILAGALLLAGPAWANATSHSHHTAAATHRMAGNP